MISPRFVRKLKGFASGFSSRLAECIEMTHCHGGVAEAAESDSKDPQLAASLPAIATRWVAFGLQRVDVQPHVYELRHTRYWTGPLEHAGSRLRRADTRKRTRTRPSLAERSPSSRPTTPKLRFLRKGHELRPQSEVVGEMSDRPLTGKNASTRSRRTPRTRTLGIA